MPALRSRIAGLNRSVIGSAERIRIDGIHLLIHRHEISIGACGVFGSRTIPSVVLIERAQSGHILVVFEVFAQRVLRINRRTVLSGVQHSTIGQSSALSDVTQLVAMVQRTYRQWPIIE